MQNAFNMRVYGGEEYETRCMFIQLKHFKLIAPGNRSKRI